MSGEVKIEVVREGLLWDYVALDGGFAIPRSFRMRAAWDDWEVEMAVEVSGGDARARSVTVMTSRPGGVTSTMLRNVPIRDVVASGCRALLARLDISGKSAKISPIRDDAFDEEAVLALKKLVGWLGEVPR